MCVELGVLLWLLLKFLGLTFFFESRVHNVCVYTLARRHISDSSFFLPSLYPYTPTHVIHNHTASVQEPRAPAPQALRSSPSKKSILHQGESSKAFTEGEYTPYICTQEKTQVDAGKTKRGQVAAAFLNVTESHPCPLYTPHHKSTHKYQQWVPHGCESQLSIYERTRNSHMGARES